MKRSKIIFLLFVVLVFAACKRNPLKVDISGINKEVEVVRFGNQMFDGLRNKDTMKVMTELNNKYPDFFNLFTSRIIRVGGADSEQFPGLMKTFLSDTARVVNVKSRVDEEFKNFVSLEEQLKKAFKYYSYHFPDTKLPTIYTYISGFNYSIVTADGIIGISLDKYLGRDYAFYKQLSTTPHYKTLNMYKDRILPDVAYAWGEKEFEGNVAEGNLLANIIQKGKIMYFVDAMLPDMQDSVKIGYTSKQLQWCNQNEPAMWTYLIEHKMLYTNKRMNIVRYTRDAPTTTGFPLGAPGRTGVWIGWQIVRQYMKKHPEVTLPELMKEPDYQMILSQSEYSPE